MTLIKSISGFRGTIGGAPNDNLTPIDIVRFVSAFCSLLQQQKANQKLKIVVGRDARTSGEMLERLVLGTAQGMGVDVISCGLSTTPTVEFMVQECQADGGIILTASHNPGQWNALKLLNDRGEFISAAEGKALLDKVEDGSIAYAQVEDLGQVQSRDDSIDLHIQHILELDLVNAKAIADAQFKVVVDGVNSTGGTAVPALLGALGVKQITELYCEPNGLFPHNPEPLAEHLGDLANRVIAEGADLGIVVDPDVDRLALMCEDGKLFGEEYTLVACADYYLKHKPGPTVSNLSSSRALADVTAQHGQSYAASAVGEVNVVEMMKATQAVIGGEGNGGIILPESHYGRDALVGIALFLSHLAELGKPKMSALKANYPAYFMSKNKIQLSPGMDVDGILLQMKERYATEKVNDIDGVKIDFDAQWVHLRKSNTEPIIRIYTEAQTQSDADQLAVKFVEEIQSLCS